MTAEIVAFPGRAERGRSDVRTVSPIVGPEHIANPATPRKSRGFASIMWGAFKWTLAFLVFLALLGAMMGV